jgi:AcrR family transcriptional regulator
MPRPQSFTDEQLLAAAREVFLERGILATTAEVAARAGVAEGTLFYRFKTKTALFQGAMKADMEEPRWFSMLTALRDGPELDATLLALGREILAHFRKAVPLLMMQWSNAPRSDAPAPPREHVPARGVSLLAGFFEAQVRAGRLGPTNCEVAARIFLGSFLHYAFQEALAPDTATPHRPAEPYVREVTRLLRQGLSAPAGAPAEAARKTPRAPRPLNRSPRKKGASS